MLWDMALLIVAEALMIGEPIGVEVISACFLSLHPLRVFAAE